jgi:hypothetical protein
MKKVWASQAGGLNHQALKIKLALAPALGQVAQGGAQVFTDGAAHAAIAHLNDLLLGIGNQNFVVDVFFAELVFDHGDLHAMGLGQHPLEQGGFARAQKTGQDSGGYQHGLLSGDECTKGGSVAIIEVSPKPPLAAQPKTGRPAKRRGTGLTF